MSRSDGTFEIEGLPDGAYYAVAFDDVPYSEIMDPEYLFLARQKATRFSLGQGEPAPLRLRIVSITK
jgi:hypothetical protein